MQQEIRQYFATLAKKSEDEPAAVFNRAGMALYRGGIETVDALRETPPEMFYDMRGIGERTRPIVLWAREKCLKAEEST